MCQGVRTRGGKVSYRGEMKSMFSRSLGLFKKRQSPMRAGLAGGGGGGGLMSED